MKELLMRYPQLEVCKEDIEKAVQAIIECYENGGKILLCGNGGSCADCDHIVGELMKGFLKKRPICAEQKAQMIDNCPDVKDVIEKLQGGLPAIALPSITALNSAFCNDVDPELIYAQPVMAMGKCGDILIGISTSGNAKNVYAAAVTAKALGMQVIGLTGNTGGKLKDISDLAVCVPEKETYKIQELHLPVYHYICAAVEAHFFSA